MTLYAFKVWGTDCSMDIIAASAEEALLHGEELLGEPPRAIHRCGEWEDEGA